MKRSLYRKQNAIAYAFVTPAAVVFLLFTMIPFVTAMLAGFSDFNLVNRWDWVGLDNFRYIFHDAFFLRSLLNILLFVAMDVPLMLVFSFLIAVLLNQNLPLTGFYRTLMYLPALTSGVASAFVWMWLFNPSKGLFNQILGALHLPQSQWIYGPSTAMISIVMVCLWGGLGGNMLIFLSALQSIPRELYEAARIDGASKYQAFFRITIPLMRNSVQFVVTMLLIGAFQLFDLVYLLTNGSYETVTPVFLIYNNAFKEFAGGIASAMSIVLMGIILLITFLSRYVIKEVEL